MDLAELHEIADKERAVVEGRPHPLLHRRRLPVRRLPQAVKKACEQAVAERRRWATGSRSAASAACGSAARGRSSRSIPSGAALREGDAGGCPVDRRRPRRRQRPTPRRGDLSQPFFARRCTSSCENSGRIDPERIEEYIAVDGYQALCTTCCAR